jgi:RNA polymerase sigma-70 factor (ECF subfamily)
MRNGVFDENAALAAAVKGDRVAFGRLVRAYQRRAYAIAYSYVSNREDALELSQEAFVRAFRAMAHFDTKMPFYPWLYRIVRNACLNHLKRKRRRGETSLDAMLDTGFDATDERPSPEAASENDELRIAIQRAMTRLTSDQQEIIRLRHFLELSYAEIAACLGIPQGTVMSRLHAARKALRRAIEESENHLVNV